MPIKKKKETRSSKRLRRLSLVEREKRIVPGSMWRFFINQTPLESESLISVGPRIPTTPFKNWSLFYTLDDGVIGNDLVKVSHKDYCIVIDPKVEDTETLHSWWTSMRWWTSMLNPAGKVFVVDYSHFLYDDEKCSNYWLWIKPK